MVCDCLARCCVFPRSSVDATSCPFLMCTQDLRWLTPRPAPQLAVLCQLPCSMATPGQSSSFSRPLLVGPLCPIWTGPCVHTPGAFCSSWAASLPLKPCRIVTRPQTLPLWDGQEAQLKVGPGATRACPVLLPVLRALQMDLLPVSSQPPFTCQVRISCPLPNPSLTPDRSPAPAACWPHPKLRGGRPYSPVGPPCSADFPADGQLVETSMARSPPKLGRGTAKRRRAQHICRKEQ